MSATTKRLWWAMATLLAAAAPALHAQEVSVDTGLHWNVHALPVKGEPGLVELVFDSPIAPGWVVYASDFEPPKIGPRPARIKLAENPAYRAEGALQSVQSRTATGSNFAGEYAYRYFGERARFRQRVRHDGEAAQVGGTLSGQSCNERTGLCTLFRENFSVAVEKAVP